MQGIVADAGQQAVEVGGSSAGKAQWQLRRRCRQAVAESIQPGGDLRRCAGGHRPQHGGDFGRSEEHTSELQSLMRISYAVFCLKKKKLIKYEILLTIYKYTYTYTTNT